MNNRLTLTVFISLFLAFTDLSAKEAGEVITLNEAINTLSLHSKQATIERLNYKNELIAFENYKKGFLPAFSVSLNPLSLNRSLRLIQDPDDGSYSNVEDYSNTTSLGVNLSQKIGITGGEINIGSNLSYLNEFSRNRNSFSTTPFSIGYSQKILGGGKLYKFEKRLEYSKNENSIKQYCEKIAEIQQKTLELYLSAILDRMESEISLKTKNSNDTLLHIANLKLNTGNITEYDLREIELQSLNSIYEYENSIKSYSESKIRLFSFLGLETTSEISMPDFNLPSFIDESNIIYYIRKNNPFYKNIEIKRLQAKQSLYSTKLNAGFNGNISLNYGVNQYSEYFVDAYRNGNVRQSISIGFQIPVFQWGINRNKIKISENTYKASTLSIEKQLEDFENDVKERISAYNHSIKLWITAEKAFNLSISQLQSIVRKFELGKVSVYEINNAQATLNNAMQRYYSAIYDSYTKYYTLRKMALYDFKTNVELIEVFIYEE